MAAMRAHDENSENENGQVYGRSVYAVFILIAVFLLAAVFGSAKWKKYLTMQSVAISGQKVVTQDDVLRLGQLSSQRALFDINLAALQTALQSNAFIRHARVQREMPSSIRVSITEREPSAMLVLSGRTDHLYIDDGGYVLPPVVSQAIYDLPVITGLDSAQLLKPGMRSTNEDVLAALDILKAAKAVSPEVSHLISEVRVHNGHDIVLYAFEGGTPIIFGQGSAVKKMATLDAFWKKFIVEGNVHGLQYIDLRFDGQVVTLPKAAAAAASPEKSTL
jgi:cell division protein FtsQ